MKKIMFATMAAWALNAHAVDFTYKGLGLGEAESAIASKLPDYGKSKYSNSFYRYEQPDCINAGGDNQAARERCRESNSFGGSIVGSGQIFVRDGVVQSVTLNIHQSFLNKLTAALTTAYGQPTVNESPVLQNGYGAKFEGRHMEWMGDNSLLTASSNGRDYIVVKISSAADAKAQDDKSKADASKAAKDF